MKTHEHFLISIGYFGTILALSDSGLPQMDLLLNSIFSVVIGGEIIDFIDHPLYHLVYGRNEAPVKEIRDSLKSEGVRSALKKIKVFEQERKFNKLWLHNFIALSIIALTAFVIGLFFSCSVYFCIGIGAFLLHMLIDVFGDYKTTGNYRNWLWLLPEKKVHNFFRDIKQLVLLFWIWWIVIIFAFISITIRSAWQLGEIIRGNILSNPPVVHILNQPITEGFVSFLPLLLLFCYFLSLLLAALAGVHKTNTELKTAGSFSKRRLNIGSLGMIRDFLFGKITKNIEQIEKIFLRVQADVAIWIIFLSSFITVALVLENGFHVDSPTLIILTVIIPALVFGTLIHSTVGEIGGVLGVFIAVICIFIASLIAPNIFVIDTKYVYTLTGAAIGAWIIGLLGAVLLKDHKRHSVTCFVLNCSINNNCDENKLLETMISNQTQIGLENGYNKAHNDLYGCSIKKVKAKQNKSDYVLLSQKDCPSLIGDKYQFSIKDCRSPLLQDLAYVLFNNELISNSEKFGVYCLIPTFPRYRMLLENGDTGDFYWEEGKICRNHINWFCMESIEHTGCYDDKNLNFGLVKTWGEFIDNLVTRKVFYQTRIYLSPLKEQAGNFLVCGLTSTYTSTKEYTTVESDYYLNSVLSEITKNFKKLPGLQINSNEIFRVFFPTTSFDDQEVYSQIEKLQFINNGFFQLFPTTKEHIINKILTLTQNKDAPGITITIRKKMLILAIQISLAYLASTMGYEFLAVIINGWF